MAVLFIFVTSSHSQDLNHDVNTLLAPLSLSVPNHLPTDVVRLGFHPRLQRIRLVGVGDHAWNTWLWGWGGSIVSSTPFCLSETLSQKEWRLGREREEAVLLQHCSPPHFPVGPLFICFALVTISSLSHCGLHFVLWPFWSATSSAIFTLVIFCPNPGKDLTPEFIESANQGYSIVSVIMPMVSICGVRCVIHQVGTSIKA